MSKTIRIKANTAGGDISTVNLYHTSIIPANLLATDVTVGTLTGSGVLVTVDDDVTTFLTQVTDAGLCNAETSSLSSDYLEPNKRYFQVINSGSIGNTVQINYPTATDPTTSSVSQTVDFQNYASFVILGTYSYPDYTSFEGWYDTEHGGTLISTNNPLTVTRDTFTQGDKFYARFIGATPPVATFTASASPTTIDEGANIAFTLTTTELTDGTTVPYTITGITAEDISVDLITGSFVVNNNSDTFTVTTTEDLLTEGTETLLLSLDNTSGSASVQIIDTSTTPVPTYSLSATSPVDEGSVVRFTLTTANVADNTVVPFNITGITADDLEENTVTGNFTVQSNTALVEFTVVADKKTEGEEVFALNLTNGEAYQHVFVQDSSILIGDVLINSGDLTVSSNSLGASGVLTATMTINYTVSVAPIVLGAPRAWVGGNTKCASGTNHTSNYYGFSPQEKAFSAIGSQAIGTYTYTSTVSWTYNGTCASHTSSPLTGAGAIQNSYCQTVNLGSGPASWNHNGTNFTNTTHALTLL